MQIKRYAGIDIGSNGVRLLIMNVYRNQSKELVFDKTILVRAPVRLGSDSFIQNEIQAKSIEMLTESMKSFYSLMKVYEVVQYRACATSALREATNSEQVINHVFDQSQIKIEIIDGKEEAEIIYKTQISEYIQDEKGYLFIDVGGGSTELTYYHQKKTIASKSFKIGSVRLMNHLVEDEEWADMREFISNLNISSDTVAVGTGGNINTIFKKSKLSLEKPMTTKYIQDLHHQLKEMTIDERIIEYKFNPDRADVVVPALEIYTFILLLSKINKIYVPKIGLADGIIRSLVS